MIGFFVLGMVLKIALGIGYSRMIRASNNMGSTKYKLFRNLKVKFETLHKLKINVNNVDTFVDKCMNNHKILGILLITWERISGQVSFVSIATGSIGAILGLSLEIDRMWILSVLSVGLLSGGLLIFFEALLNKRARREIIRLNIIDYLENYLNNRLEQENANPELIQKYKKYFAKQSDLEVKNLTAAADNLIEIELDEDLDSGYKKPSFRTRRIKAREERKRRKEEKRATKQFMKQARKAAKAKRKEDRAKRKLKAKQERQFKAEEKRREAEIKKALKLEKKLSSNSRRSKKITPAQKSKESLKQEIKELRQLELRSQDEEVANDDGLKYEYDTVRNISGTRQSIDKVNWGENNESKQASNVTDIDEGRAKRNVDNGNKLGKTRQASDSKTGNVESQVAATKEDSNLKTDKGQEPANILRNSQGNKIKRKAKLSKEDRQIIEDILKEYLA